MGVFENIGEGILSTAKKVGEKASEKLEKTQKEQEKEKESESNKSEIKGTGYIIAILGTLLNNKKILCMMK